MFNSIATHQIKMFLVLLVFFVGIATLIGSVVPIFYENAGKKPQKNTIQNKLIAYFNLSDGMDLKFAHAVNSQEKLIAAMRDSSILMIEADVLMDKVKNIPIMAHPPATSSDLTLTQFLNLVLSSNIDKGIKLDFKQIEAVKPSIGILKTVLADSKFKSHKPLPIMLNADILVGPNQPNQVPVNASEFVKLAKLDGFSFDILSPGWTTANANCKTFCEGYTWKMVKEMESILKHAKGPVTLPVRASLVSRSKEQLLWLLEKPNYTLTLWHSKLDEYDIKNVAFLREYPCKVYYDLPEEMRKELREISF